MKKNKEYILDNQGLMAEWDWEQNNLNDIFPDKVSYGSDIKPFWICRQCGNKYRAAAYHRVKGQGCPICRYIKSGKSHTKSSMSKNGSFASIHPNLLSEWLYEKNNIQPNEISEFCNKKFYWKCSKCGNIWQSTTGNRVRGRGCPECAKKQKSQTRHFSELKKNGSFAQNCPNLIKEWDWVSNNKKGIDPFSIPITYLDMVSWICGKCGKKYLSYTFTRKKGAGCPYCGAVKKYSLPEKIIFYYIKLTYSDALENYKTKFLGKKEIDIYIPSLKVGIEYDGERYHKNVEEDIEKIHICKNNGIQLLRIREPLCPLLIDDNIFTMKDKNDIKPILVFLNNKLNLNINLENINYRQDKLKVLSDITTYEMNHSLAKMYPDIANEWDEQMNGNLKPSRVPSQSNLKVHWICKKGHKYESVISNRTRRGYGCPSCAGRFAIPGENDLQTTQPNIIKYWDYKGNSILPNQIKEHSEKMVAWICPICKNRWNEKVCNMTKRKIKCKNCRKN